MLGDILNTIGKRVMGIIDSNPAEITEADGKVEAEWKELKEKGDACKEAKREDD